MKNSANQLNDQVLVIFGASGDLTYRKLIPSVFDLYMQNLLPKNFAVLGVSRSSFSDEEFREKLKPGIKEFALFKDAPKEKIEFFSKLLFYASVDTNDEEDYAKIKTRLKQIDEKLNTGENFIYYLSTPPALYTKIPKALAKHGLNKAQNNKNWRRIIIEKPFGTDLESAQSLNQFLLKHFDENQIYRIDHYLGKETVQNLLVARFANGIYEPLWNRNFIDRVEVTAAESIGVGSRGGYYEHSGALRDMLQNHLMQVVALIAMEPPTKINAMAIRNEKLKVFQSLRTLSEEAIRKDVVRGQYLAANVNGETLKAYREEQGVDPASRTETYIAMKFFIDNWRWGDVPFYIRTGKRLPTRVTEVVIHFKPTPHQLFVENKEMIRNGNSLVIRIQPDEGILLKTGLKVPGAGYKVADVNMDFRYKDLQETYVPSAYERLLLDSMQGDATLYARGDGVEEAWKFVQPVLDYFENGDADLFGYPSGTWGPDTADDLIAGKYKAWRYPCENKTDNRNFCKL